VNQHIRTGIDKLVGMLGEDGLRELLEHSGSKEAHLLEQMRKQHGNGKAAGRSDPVRRTSRKTPPRPRKKVERKDTLAERVQAYLKEHGPTMRSDLWKAMGLTGPLRLNKAISTLRTRGLLDGGGNKHHPQPYYLK